MEIKGLNDFQDNMKIKSSNKGFSIKSEDSLQVSKSQTIENKYVPSNMRIKQLMSEIKNIERKVSEKQYYLDKLVRVKKELISRKSVPQIVSEILLIKEKAKFNQKPVMFNIIPDKDSLNNSNSDLKGLQEKVTSEISKIQASLKKDQNQVSKFAISIENFNASTSKSNIKDLKHLFNKEMLYKNFNKNIVISLMS